jgi:hypothetical protein
MIQIKLRPEVESQLAREAEGLGLALERYVEQIVEARSPAAVETEADRKCAE